MKLKIIDCNTSVGYWPTLKDAETQLNKYMQEENIDVSLLSFDGSEIVREDENHRRIFSQLIAFKKGLEFIKNNNKFRLVLWVRPNTENNINEVSKFIKNNIEYIAAIKLNPTLSNLNILDAKNVEYFRLAERYNLPVILESKNDNFSNLKSIKTCANMWPHLSFILILNNPNFNINVTISLLKNCPNIYFGTSTINIENLDAILSAGFIKKVLFSSSIANKNSIEQFDAIRNIIDNKIHMNESEYNSIMNENALRVFSIIQEKK